LEDRFSHHDGHEMASGLYEEVITEQLSTALAKLQETGLEPVEGIVEEQNAPQVLARHVSDVTRRVLSQLPRDQQVAIANEIIETIVAAQQSTGLAGAVPPQTPAVRLVNGPKQLLAIAEREAPGVYRISPTRPQTPMGEVGLLTNAPGDPSLGSELRAELTSADGVDLLCAFVKWTGLSVLHDQLSAAAQRGVPLRVITTTYIGATERRALDWLVRTFGAQVKVNYEVNSTRLHAKAWMFRRRTGYDTGYVGSSNLSQAALLDGMEWNVRLSSLSSKPALDKFRATFDAYWADEAFEDYDPDRDAERLDAALARAKAWSGAGTFGRGAGGGDQPGAAAQEEPMRPLRHQKEMLEHLRLAREVHDTNLLVAATGTGKTVMAAFDFLQLRQQLGSNDLTLLFIAHRHEILEQARNTYRRVLNKPEFGEILGNGEVPKHWRHVFATVQSLAHRVGEHDRDKFDVIVIDECHHAVAPTYKKVLEHYQAKDLLGLTATPERMDGKHIQDALFQGRIAAEMRLWEALEDGLLCPFHYFGLNDGTDLSRVKMVGGEYQETELTEALLANGVQARHVLQEVKQRFSDPQAIRALGFCVNVKHAQHMADAFNQAGIAAKAVTGSTPAPEREAALTALRDGRIRVLFSVDLFNEGLDIPDVDTLIMLRPTASATVFLQQLGRGLRRSPSKVVLTVLDFIGHQHEKFRFEPRFRALTGYTNKEIISGLEQGFTRLPAGCDIILDPVSQERVLKNIRDQVEWDVNALAEEIRTSGERTLAGYLRRSQREITELYDTRSKCWTTLLRRAGLPTAAEGPREGELLKRIRSVLHVDDPERLVAYSRLIREERSYEDLDARSQAYARMLFFSFFPSAAGLSTYQEGLELIRSHPAVREELEQVLAMDLSRAPYQPAPLSGPHARLPLALHGTYSREEIYTALGFVRLGGRLPAYTNEGVAWCKDIRTDAFLITIEKDPKQFTEGTRYNDYAIGPQLFHWETQGRTAAGSPTAQRYVNHEQMGSHVLLFVRRTKETETRLPQPWVLLGPARHVSHEGSKPVKIVWQLEHAMPDHAYQQFRLETGES
jgi:superfamily II DNA or RNA helicase/HKD family nuclease